MASINWDKYHIVTTALLNRIVIAKAGKEMNVILDKSEDRTREAVSAVYQHMQGEYGAKKVKDNKIINLEFTFEDGGKLIYEPPFNKEG